MGGKSGRETSRREMIVVLIMTSKNECPGHYGGLRVSSDVALGVLARSKHWPGEFPHVACPTAQTADLTYSGSVPLHTPGRL